LLETERGYDTSDEEADDALKKLMKNLKMDEHDVELKSIKQESLSVESEDNDDARLKELVGEFSQNKKDRIREEKSATLKRKEGLVKSKSKG